MPVDQKRLDALDIDQFDLEPKFPAVSIRAENYTDSDGEPAIRILVILDESADIDQIGGARISEFKSAIRKSLRDQGITEFPYIFLAKQSELDEHDDAE